MRVTPPGPVVEEVCAAEITHLWPEGKSLIPGAATMLADFLWNWGCYGARYGRRRQHGAAFRRDRRRPKHQTQIRRRLIFVAAEIGAALRRTARSARPACSRREQQVETTLAALPRLRRRTPLLSLLSAGNLQPSALSRFDKPTVRKPAHNLKIRYDHGNFIVSGKHGTRKADPDPPLSSRRVETRPMLATLPHRLASHIICDREMWHPIHVFQELAFGSEKSATHYETCGCAGRESASRTLANR